MWTSTNGENIWSMARWRWRSSTAWSKERSSSRSKARLIAPLWPKAREIRPESRSRQLLAYFCAHRKPDRNPTPGSLSTAILVPFFAATDTTIVYVWELNSGMPTAGIQSIVAAVDRGDHRSEEDKSELQ